MTKLRLRTLARRLRHVRRSSKTVTRYRAWALLGIALLTALVLVVYGFIRQDRLSGPEGDSVDIYLGKNLAGCITQEDLAQPDAQGRRSAGLLDLLEAYGVEPLQGEALSYMDESGTEHQLSQDDEHLERTYLVRDNGRWLLQDADGRSDDLISIHIHVVPLEETTDIS